MELPPKIRKKVLKHLSPEVVHVETEEEGVISRWYFPALTP